MRAPFKRQARLRLRLPADHRNHVHFALPPRQTVYIEAWGRHVTADPFPPASGVELQRAYDRIQQIHRQTMKDYL
ncbi:hypothetical protein [Rhodococcoides fascians]|uniref:hypothetical protein n=1 Tax=Rhodococcoides fascians TaxID=1828 RepID=UPI00050C04C9|nr:hypothetical protein [Rhodococcus fascians]